MKERIKEIAKRKKVTLQFLAEKLGVTYSALWQKLNTPKVSTLEKIAQALNCEMAELLPLGDDFMHIYNDKGEWQGIMKKPK